MPRFFTGNINGNNAEITGGDAEHISKSLRMREGESIVVCDARGFDYDCRITEASPELVRLEVLAKKPSEAEPCVKVTLFQGLPKSDKMDYIVQKTVELGVSSIVPVITARSVSRPDEKSRKTKTERWNKISLEAAKQSGRGIIPEVASPVCFDEALRRLSELEEKLMFYECQNGGISGKLNCGAVEMGVFIGPEGGFDREEVETAKAAGVRIEGLGPRILRTETAPLCALSAIMYATGNL